MSGFVELFLTDGTTKIDLLSANRGLGGFGLQSYTPGRPQLKNDGVWQDSPLAIGRQLAYGVQANTSDALTLVCGGKSQSEIILAFEELDLLLDKATAYWLTNWQQTPVYLQARVKGETNRRYALIHYAKYDNYFDPHGQLFAGPGLGVATDPFVLGIERGLWLDLVPGAYEAIAISNVQSGEVQTGYEYVGSEGVLIGNINNPGLTHVFQFTASGSVFSSNLLDGSPPYNLLGTTMAVNNALYMGADFPFYAVKFELSVAAGASTIIWGVSNGSGGWEEFSTSDSDPDFMPSKLTELSPQRVQIALFRPQSSGSPPPALWEPDTVNGVEKYWLRARVSSVTDSTSPVQSNRHVYAATRPYIEVAEDDVIGTQPALSRISMGFYDDLGETTKILVALRSYDRGANFTPHLNVGGANPSGVTYAVGSDASVFEEPDLMSAGGTSVTVTPTPGGAFRDAVSFALDGTIFQSYYGRFRLFGRITRGSGSPLVRYILRLPGTTSASDVLFTSPSQIPPIGSAPDLGLLDFGYITLPVSDFFLTTDIFDGITISIQAGVDAAGSITIYGLILLPADEWIAELSGARGTVEFDEFEQALIADPISYPKYPNRALSAATEPNGAVRKNVTMVTSGPPILQARARQRYWFLLGSGPGAAAGIHLNKVQRFIGLRGDA